MGGLFWYSEEGSERAATPPSPLLAVPNHCIAMMVRCSAVFFTVAIKGLFCYRGCRFIGVQVGHPMMVPATCCMRTGWLGLRLPSTVALTTRTLRTSSPANISTGCVDSPSTANSGSVSSQQIFSGLKKFICNRNQ